jgi:hypothetical protein
MINYEIGMENLSSVEAGGGFSKLTASCSPLVALYSSFAVGCKNMS